ncbi:unnamed protein product [Phaedon cochleariae]|uniref:C2H2-type domain-containing protein n=1 Tax=Phaedon cochleariae TaxID=80249 RepID=A0A9N9X2J2_PHACE|nr:unnamed protein product [Phaedon cochleariae]
MQLILKAELIVFPDFIELILSDKENLSKGKKQKKKTNRDSFDISALNELFMCTRCTKTYRLRHSLTRHMKFECGKEPQYACALCPRKFKHKYDLNVHERGKHSLVKQEVILFN